MKFTITFEVPDGTTYRVNVDPEATAVGVVNTPQYVAPFEDELIPLPDGAIPLPGDIQTPLPDQFAPVPFRGMAHNPPPNNGCPVHHVPWKMVPAGISKKTGKPYSAFAVCSVQDCDQRPPQ